MTPRARSGRVHEAQIYRVQQKQGLLESGSSGNNLGVIIYSFNLNVSPKVSYGVLGCDIVMLQNYMLMIL